MVTSNHSFIFRNGCLSASDIGSQPFLWLVCYVGMYIHDAVRYRTAVLSHLIDSCLSHTFGMGIIVLIVVSQPFYGWLPIFDADGIPQPLRTPVPFHRKRHHRYNLFLYRH